MKSSPINDDNKVGRWPYSIDFFGKYAKKVFFSHVKHVATLCSYVDSAVGTLFKPFSLDIELRPPRVHKKLGPNTARSFVPPGIYVL